MVSRRQHNRKGREGDRVGVGAGKGRGGRGGAFRPDSIRPHAQHLQTHQPASL